MDFVLLNIVNVALHSKKNKHMKFKPKQEHCDLFLTCAMDGGIEELGHTHRNAIGYEQSAIRLSSRSMSGYFDVTQM